MRSICCVCAGIVHALDSFIYHSAGEASCFLRFPWFLGLELEDERLVVGAVVEVTRRRVEVGRYAVGRRAVAFVDVTKAVVTAA